MDLTVHPDPIGSFQCSTGELWVTDPCYLPGTWCQGKLTNVLKGTFHGFVRGSDEGAFGTRIADIMVVHESAGSVEFDDARFQHEEMTVGVDSGQAGFFDGDTEIGSGDPGDAGTFYGKCCDLTSETDTNAGSLECGVVSSSGYGDGAYNCSTIKDAEGRVIAAKINFLGEEDEEYEEDEEVEEVEED